MRSARDSVRDLGDGRYRVAITVGYHPETGRQVRVDRTFRCGKRELAGRIDDLRREYGTVEVVEYGDMPVAAFVRDVWLEPRRKGLAATTLAGYDATIRNHVVPRLSGIRMRQANALNLGAVLSVIESAGAALNVYKMLRSAFRVAVGAGVVSGDPLALVPKPQTAPYHADVYDFAETLRLLDVFRDTAIEPGVIVMATCGTRLSETCALDWSDLHLGRVRTGAGEVAWEGEVRIRGSYHRVAGERVSSATKTPASAAPVALPGFAVARLVELRGDGRLGPLMTDATGQRMTPDGFSARWRRMLLPRDSKDGTRLYTPPMRHIPPKCLRHSHTTWLLDELAVPLRKVSQRDRHVRESTTQEFYDRHKQAADHDVARLIDDAYRALTRAKDVSADGGGGGGA